MSDINPTNEYNETPVDMARGNHQIEVLRLYKKYGIVSTLFDDFNDTDYSRYDTVRGVYI